MEKTWQGRFKKKMDPEADAFNASVSFDKRLFKHDVVSGLSHAKALKKAGILTASEEKRVTSGLKSLLKKEKSIDFSAYEDVHSTVEGELVKTIGPLGKKLHTGRSRNDLVANDTRLYMMEEAATVKKLLEKLMARLVLSAENNASVYMPGYTHMQHAQIVSAGHWFMAYFSMLRRDWDLFDFVKNRADRLIIGSGALAGSNYKLDRKLLAKYAGFKNISGNSMDAVSDRDFILDFLYAASVTAAHLSRLAEEIVIFNTTEFGFLEIDDSFATGSSIMPQKKNPDIAELIRGRAGKFSGRLMAGLTMIKGLPLSYNKDLQEDKELFFASLDEIKAILSVAEKLLGAVKFREEKTSKQLEDHFMYAVDIADYLVKKGVPFRESHSITGGMVLYSLEKRKPFKRFEKEELKSFSEKFGDDYYSIFTPAASLGSKATAGSASPASVRKQIKDAKKFLKKPAKKK
jgi:argininosuccinate lyase